MQKLFLIPAFLFLLVAVNSDAQLAQPGGAGTVNVGQINGVAPTMGNGVSGTGVTRVTLASDSTGQVTLATGASVIATQTTATSLKAEVVGPTADNAANPTAKLATLPAVALAAAPTRTEGNVVPLRTNLAGDVAITLDSEAVVLGAGSATIGALTANQSVNTAQIAGVAPSLNTGVRDAGTPRVTIATDDVVPASQSGTWTVQPGNTANTTAWKVDGSAVTQPVSGTVTANAGTGTMTVTGAVTPADGFANPTTALSGIAISSEFNGTTHDRVRSAFNQATTGVTTNAAGTAVNLTTTPMSKFTMVIDRTVGATDTVEVDFECSLDNAIWVQIMTTTSLASEPTLASQDGTPCNHMRYNVVTVGAGNTLTVQLLAVR